MRIERMMQKDEVQEGIQSMILNYIWDSVHFRDPMFACIGVVVRTLVCELEELGYTASVTERGDDYRIIQVDEFKFLVYLTDKFGPYRVRVEK